MKVGKAIYNILSKSTDVQSNFPFNTTDYAPTGTELVTNGNFSAAGSNLVSNPNFTDTGSELVVNGDFATDSDWTLNHWTISGGVAVADGSSALSIYQGATSGVVGKSYKVTYEVVSISQGSFRFEFGDVSGLARTTTGIYTEYITAISTDRIRIYPTDSAIGTVTDVSVKELGADWTIINGAGGDTVTFGDSFAEITKTNAQAVYLQQDYAVTLGASHKLTYTITENTFTGGGTELGLSGASAYGGSTLDSSASATPKTVYLTVTDDTPLAALRFYSNDTGGSIKITNISIQELGEGWTLVGVDATNTISIESGGARVISVGTNISLRQTILEVGKSYKLTCNTTITTGKLGLDGTTAGTTINLIEGANVVYFTATSQTFSIKRVDSVSNVLIDNITVQEMILTKIFPELAPPDIDAPYIVYSVVSNSPSETKNANGDIDTASIEVYGFQDTYNKAVDLGVSVRAALDRKTGTYNTIQIQSTNYVNEQMDVNEARKLWAAIQDYSIRIKNI